MAKYSIVLTKPEYWFHVVEANNLEDAIAQAKMEVSAEEMARADEFDAVMDECGVATEEDIRDWEYILSAKEYRRY